MNNGLITLNIPGHDERSFEMMRGMSPRYVVSTATHMGGHTKHIRRILDENPGITVIARGVYHGEDSLDRFPEYWDAHDEMESVDQFLVNAAVWMREIGWEYSDRVLFHTFNETGGRTECTDASPTFEDWIEWHRRLEFRGRQIGLAFCHLNHSLGTPNGDQYHLFKPLLEACKGGRSVIGLHEYFTQPTFDSPDDLSWIIGRYKWMYEACPGCDEVPVVLTEWGEAQGWQVVPGDENYWAEEFIRCADWYTHDPRVQGLAFFCYKGWHPWNTNHDIDGAPTIQQAFITHQVQIKEPPVSTPCDTPVDMLDATTAGTYKALTLVKVRNSPSTHECAKHERTVQPGEEITISGSVIREGFIWGYITEELSWTALGPKDILGGPHFYAKMEDEPPIEVVEVSVVELQIMRDVTVGILSYTRQLGAIINTLITRMEEKE